MDYIALSDAHTLVLFVGAVAVFAAFLISMIASFSARKTIVALAYFVPGMAAVAGIVLLTSGILAEISGDARDARIASFVDRYDWEPTPKQLSDLQYPEWAPKEGVSDLYGHTDIDVEGHSITIQLAWDGRKLLVLDMSDASELDRTR